LAPHGEENKRIGPNSTPQKKAIGVWPTPKGTTGISQRLGKKWAEMEKRESPTPGFNPLLGALEGEKELRGGTFGKGGRNGPLDRVFFVFPIGRGGGGNAANPKKGDSGLTVGTGVHPKRGMGRHDLYQAGPSGERKNEDAARFPSPRQGGWKEADVPRWPGLTKRSSREGKQQE